MDFLGGQVAWHDESFTKSQRCRRWKAHFPRNGASATRNFCAWGVAAQRVRDYSCTSNAPSAEVARFVSAESEYPSLPSYLQLLAISPSGLLGGRHLHDRTTGSQGFRRELPQQSAIPRRETAELPLPVLQEHVGNGCLNAQILRLGRGGAAGARPCPRLRPWVRVCSRHASSRSSMFASPALVSSNSAHGDALFVDDIAPLLRPGVEYDARTAWPVVHEALVRRLPGEPWRGGSS